MLILPASFQGLRGVLLAIMLGYSLWKMFSFPLKYNKNLFLLALINIFFSFLFILNGIVLSAPGAIKVSTVYLIWPILYLFFIGMADKKETMLPILRTIIYGGIVSVVLILLFMANSFIGLPIDITALAKAQDFHMFYDIGIIELHSMNLTTVLYSFVFVLAILFIPKQYNAIIKSKIILRIALLASLILIFISSRRAFWLISAISPLIVLALLKVCRVDLNFKRFIMPTIIFFSILFTTFGFLDLDIDNLTSQLNSTYEFNNPDAESNYLRKLQFDALINGWENHKIIGAGLGAAVQESVRDEDAPWSYELSYVALLFQTGIVGVLVYSLSILWILVESIKLVRKNTNYVSFIIPQIAALICFLLVNATNPYLAKFDYLWTIFLPIASLNVIMLDKNKDHE